MSSPAARAATLMAELGAHFDDYGEHTQLIGTVEAPDGKVWKATGTHGLAVGFHTDRPAGWRWVMAEIGQGLDDCDGANCDVCAETAAKP